MNGEGKGDAGALRLYQSFERFQQYDENHVDFAEKIAKLGSAAPKRTGPKSGQWNVSVHVPLVDKSAKPKKVAAAAQVKRWLGTDGDSNAGSHGARRGGAEAEPVVKSRAPEAQVIKIQNKLAHRYTAKLPPEMTMKQAQVRWERKCTQCLPGHAPQPPLARLQNTSCVSTARILEYAQHLTALLGFLSMHNA